MGLYKKGCEATKEEDKRRRYWTYVEKDGGRDEIRDDLAETIRSHYDRLERIAEDVERPGYKVAAAILREAMPQTAKGRSGDLGRNMAMRGDDFIGAGYDGAGEREALASER